MVFEREEKRLRRCRKWKMQLYAQVWGWSNPLTGQTAEMRMIGAKDVSAAVAFKVIDVLLHHTKRPAFSFSCAHHARILPLLRLNGIGR